MEDVPVFWRHFEELSLQNDVRLATNNLILSEQPLGAVKCHKQTGQDLLSVRAAHPLRPSAWTLHRGDLRAEASGASALLEVDGPMGRCFSLPLTMLTQGP